MFYSSRRFSLSSLALLFALLLGAACGSGDDGPGDGGGGEINGGQGGSGGGDGGDGFGGEGGSEPGPGGSGGEDEPPPPPPWDDHELSLLWRHQGFGEVWDLAVGNFLGNGEEQIAVGGRRPALISADGSEVIWFKDWEQGENLLRGGDNDWVYTLAPIRNEEGLDDLLVSHSMGGAYLLDGRDGTPIWTIPLLDQRFPFPHVVLFGDPEDPSFIPRWGRSAYSAKSGDVIWENPLASDPAAFITPARQGSGSPTGLYLATEGVELVGGGGSAWREYPKIASLSASGEVGFVVELRDGDDGIMPVAIAAADFDGEGVDSLVVALFDEPMRAYDPEGGLRWERDLVFWEEGIRTRISEIVVKDFDGDGRDEIIVFAHDSYGLGTPDGDATLVVFDWEGQEQFRLDYNLPVASTQIVDVDDGAPLLLLGTGTSALGDYGHVLGVRLDLVANPNFDELTAFKLRIPAQAKALALQGSGSIAKVIVGTDDGVLWSVDLEGESLWTHHLSGFMSTLASIPGSEGEDWVAFGDNSGALALLNPAGEKVWHRFMEVGSHGAVAQVAAARLEEGGELTIAAVAAANTENFSGILEAYSFAGEKLLSRPLQGEGLALAAADLDGDGVDELLVLEGVSALSADCRLRAFDSGGHFLWEVPLTFCMLGQISVGDMDGSGEPSIGVFTHPLLPHTGYPTSLSVVANDGRLRWYHEEDWQTSGWIQASPLGLINGGRTTEDNGFVELRGPDSDEVLWRTLLDPRPDPANPLRNISGQSSNGTVVGSADGFGVAVTNWSNDLYFIDGATGEISWSVFTETEENWISARHRGGPVAFVPQTESTPPYLLFAQNDASRRRSEAMAISLDGEIMSRKPILSPSTELAVMQGPGGAPSVAVKTLLGIYRFELVENEASEAPEE